MFGRRWLTEEAATQPRSALGIGHLHVAKYMQAAWAQPLLDAMGRTTEDRPYKHYFAYYARQAYPDLGMGREMLSLNLSFSRIVDGPLDAMPGEARHEHGLGPIRHDTSIYTRSYTVPRFPHHVSGSFLAKRASRDEGPPGNLRFAGVNSGLDASCSPGGSQCMRYVSSRALR